MKTKHFLLTALFLLMAGAMSAQTYWNGTSNKVFSGQGTQADPYLISTPEQLAGLAERVNDDEDFAGKYIKLTADIYLNDFSVADTSTYHNWEPIGHFVRQPANEEEGIEGYQKKFYFRGHFDGDGHTVYNMYYYGCNDWGGDWDPDDPEFDPSAWIANLDYSCWYRSLFGYIADTVENLRVENTKLISLGLAPFAQEVAEGGTVRNCHVKDFELTSTLASQGGAGFIITNAGLIENCSVEGHLTDNLNIQAGLVAENQSTGIIRGCNSKLSANNSDAYGIAGTNIGLIEQTSATVDLTLNTSKAGRGNNGAGMVYANYGTIRDSYTEGTIRAIGAHSTFAKGDKIAGFCLSNHGLLESCYSVCNLIDLKTEDDDNSHIGMAQFVYYNGDYADHNNDAPTTGKAINCFAAGTLTTTPVSDANRLPLVNTFSAVTNGGFNREAFLPSSEINCYWNEDNLPTVTVTPNFVQDGWRGTAATLAYMQSHAFVDTLNRVASFLGISQWEYRAGQLPRATSLRTQDKTVFFANGDGSKTNPYQVSSKAELENVAWLTNHGYDFRNEYIKQTADIELNAPQAEWGETAPTHWTPIGARLTHSYFNGSRTASFRGTYDGDFHEVKNMYINSTLATQGLFGHIGNDGFALKYEGATEENQIVPASVRNLGVTGVYVRAVSAGAVVGEVDSYSDILQCWSTGNIYSVSSSVAESHIAGIAGTVNRYSHILNNKTSVSLTRAQNNSSNEYWAAITSAVSDGLADTLVNALYYGATAQPMMVYAYSSSGRTENLIRDTTLSNYAMLEPEVSSYSTERMQQKELVNRLNATVSEWNSTHGEDLQLDYWEWVENDYPHVNPNVVSQLVTVTYESNGGSTLLPMRVVSDSQILPPARPTKDGYIFNAWYRDAACTDFFDFKRDSVQGNMTLYAKWLADTRSDYDLTPFQNEFATTYHIKTAAQLRGLAVVQFGIYDWLSCDFTGNSSTNHPTITAPMDFTGKTIVLDNDIFLNDTTGWQHWGNNCYAVPWAPIGRSLPVGDYTDVAFKGTFDGQGHTIYGMYCEVGTVLAGESDRYNTQWGLFAVLSGATVRNVGVEASVIDLRKHDDAPRPLETKDNGYEWYYTQNGNYPWIQDATHAGLLIGRINDATVEQCYAKGKIIPMEQQIGYADISDNYLGGLISNVEGYSSKTTGTISNCFAQVDISREQKNDAKGYSLLGNGYNIYSQITFTNCYGAGHTSQGNNIATTYYNKELVTTTASNASAKSTFEMHTMNAYKDWDFTNIWGRNDTVNGGYPFLRIFHPDIQNSPDPVIVTGITIDQTTATIYDGDSLQLHASVLPADAVIQDIQWTISCKETVATVDANGMVRVVKNTAQGYSTQDITVTATSVDGGYSKECTVTIVYPALNFVGTPTAARRIGATTWGTRPSTSSYQLVQGYEYLIAAYSNPSGAHTPVTWTSSNEDIATVESLTDDSTYTYYTPYAASYAVVRCMGEGSVKITATDERGETASYTYTATNYPVTSISLSSTASDNMLLGDSRQMKDYLTYTPTYASEVPQCIWTSSAPDIISVDENGQAEALAVGTAVITATYGELTASATITVNPVEVTEVTMSETSITMYVGDTYQLSASVVPENATDKTITWSSTRTTYATVDENGLVTALRKGSTTIRATAPNGKYGSCSVTIQAAVTFTITFLDWDGTVLQKGDVREGTVPVYTGATPTKPEDANYTYSFSGWSPAIVAATADADYTAQFEATEKKSVSIEDIRTDASSAPRKIMIDNIIYILRGDKIYTLQGQEVK